MPLDKSEREIVLVITDEDTEWSIYCSSPTMETKLRKAGFEHYKEDEDGKFYRIARNRISFKKPPKGRIFTEEERKAASERFKRMHEKKKEQGDE